MSEQLVKSALGGMLSLAMLSSSAAVLAEGDLDTSELLKRLNALEGELKDLKGQNENLRSELGELRESNPAQNEAASEAQAALDKISAESADEKELASTDKSKSAEVKSSSSKSVAKLEKPSAAPEPSYPKVDPNSPDSYYTYGTGDKVYATLEEVMRKNGQKMPQYAQRPASTRPPATTSTAQTGNAVSRVPPTQPPRATQTAQVGNAVSRVPPTRPPVATQTAHAGNSIGRVEPVRVTQVNDIPEVMPLDDLGMAVVPANQANHININQDALALANNNFVPPAAPSPSRPSFWSEAPTVSQDQVIRNAYDSAYRTMLSNPAAAVPAFRAFVRDHHNHPLAGQAQYWVGEALFSLRDYGAATEAFMRVLKDYKNSERAPDAALKLGYSFYALQQWEFARRTLEDVKRFFPNSSAAQLAAGRLEVMTSEGH